MAVPAPGTLAADMAEAIVDEAGHEGVDDAVVGLASLVARRDQLEMAQERELMAHRRHRQAERVREIADAQLVVSERVDDAQAQRAGEREEDPDGLGRGV